MGQTTYRTIDGDVLDELCQRHYGHLAGAVEAVYTANPGLASIAQPYHAGQQITFPELPAPRADNLRLWG